jgi:hypothetical protein
MDRGIPRDSLLRWLFPACFQGSAEAGSHAEHNNSAAHTFWHHLPVVFVLVAVAVIVHHYHWVTGLTAQTMRLVYWADKSWPGLKWAEGEIKRQANLKELEPALLTVLRFTPNGFQNEFCGLSPVPRRRMAALIEGVASALPQADATGSKPVVGIDVDITSLRGSRSCVVDLACPPNMTGSGAKKLCHEGADDRVETAMRSLTKKARVVVVAFPRLGVEARKVRNESMLRLCRLGVTFASAQAFLDPGEPFYHFLNKRKPEPKFDWSTQAHAQYQIPVYFPSLGNVMSLLAQQAKQPVESTYRETTEALCKAAEFQFPQGLLLAVGDIPEAAPHGASEFRPEDLYDGSYLDLMRGSVRTHLEPVDHIPAMVKAVGNAIQEWTQRPRTAPPMFIVAIDDGHTDKYFTVQNAYVSGDSIQALTAFSQKKPLEVSPALDALIDLFLGCMYLGCWVWVWTRLRRLRRTAPVSATVMLVSAPALLAIFLSVLTVWFSARMLQHGHWIDPLLMFLGLTVHAYLTLAQEAGEGMSGQGRAGRRGFDGHIACGGSLVLKMTGLALVVWAIAVIVKH